MRNLIILTVQESELTKGYRWQIRAVACVYSLAELWRTVPFSPLETKPQSPEESWVICSPNRPACVLLEDALVVWDIRI